MPCRNINIRIPLQRSGDLAEFMGVMLGDGKLSRFQVMVTLGNKEFQYANYLKNLFIILFGVHPHTSFRGEKRYQTIYIGSVALSSWLLNEGLVYNKVRSQVDMPKWIYDDRSFMTRFVRGFFDTDGSIYKLKYGLQLSFTNYSMPLLISLQQVLRKLGYRVSEISGPRFYITKVSEIQRFFAEIDPQNSRHKNRYLDFIK